MSFIAVDVETANSDLSSICQIGVACFTDGSLGDTWKSLINPKDSFDPINVAIHGIDEETVRLSPTWKQVYPKVVQFLQGNIVVSHTAFDRVAIHRACEKNNEDAFECQWLDSAKVVRRTWPMFARSGYGLAPVACYLGISFRHHDALEDACCSGKILQRAIAESGLSVSEWLERVRHPIDSSLKGPITRHGSPEGPLHGEVLVFTGELSVPRREAADLAAAAGCEVAASVNKHTTLLVVGDQDVRKLAGHNKSSKQRKVEELIAKGQHIRIISENDFRRITAVETAHLVAHA